MNLNPKLGTEQLHKIHNVLKNLVKTDENDMYSVNYTDMVALLCASLKDAHTKIDELSAFMDNSD